MNYSRSLCVLVLLAVLFVVPTVTAGVVDAPAGDAGQSEQAGQSDQSGGKGSDCALLAWVKNLFHKDPALQKEAMLKLLELVVKDIELALNTLGGKDVCYLKMFPAIEHVNHALKTLNKIHPPKHLKEVFNQVEKRLSHTKFCLVVKDTDEAAARLQSALEYIKTLQQ